jgi:hypothetical protein
MRVLAAVDSAYAEGIASGRAYRAVSARISIAEHRRIDRILREGATELGDHEFLKGLRSGLQSVADPTDSSKEAHHGSERY